MAIGSGINLPASITYSNSQFGSDTPWARAAAGLPAPSTAPIDNVINAPNTYMPMLGRVPVDTQAPAAAPKWTLEGDPVYQAAMSAGQASFNYARNAALADKQNTQTAKNAERKALDVNATEARRRTAGNYAARGMAGGAAGALSQAEALANARQIAAQTSIADQLAAVNNQYLQNFGAIGSDWTGTLVGQQYKTQAAQQALESALARYGTV